MKTRAKKHNLYYYIDKELSIYADIEADMSIVKMSFVIDNHSLTEEEAELIARKLRAVLNGADVIEAPSDEERVRQEVIDKACEVLHKTGAFELMAADEGMSAACMEDQFRKIMEEKNVSIQSERN